MKKKILYFLMINLVMFVLVGCGSNTIKNVDDLISESKEAVSEAKDKVVEEVNKADNDEDKIDLYSDDSKIVFANGTVKLVYYYSGDKITAYHTYIDYADAATAKYALSILNKDDTMGKAYTNGKYLVIEHSESEYEGLTVSEVRATYSYLEEVQKN